jgi:hypothetical protein
MDVAADARRQWGVFAADGFLLERLFLWLLRRLVPIVTPQSRDEIMSSSLFALAMLLYSEPRQETLVAVDVVVAADDEVKVPGMMMGE